GLESGGAPGVLQPGQRDAERPNQHGEWIRGKPPPRRESSRGITRGPPRGTVRRISDALGGALEDLAVGFGTERFACCFTRLLDLVAGLKPGLLLPLANQGSRGIAEPEQSLVEPIDQGSARRRITFFDKGPAHCSVFRRPWSVVRSTLPGPSRAPGERRWPDGSSSRPARFAADRRDRPLCAGAGSLRSGQPGEPPAASASRRRSATPCPAASPRLSFPR